MQQNDMDVRNASDSPKASQTLTSKVSRDLLRKKANVVVLGNILRFTSLYTPGAKFPLSQTAACKPTTSQEMRTWLDTMRCTCSEEAWRK